MLLASLTSSYCAPASRLTFFWRWRADESSPSPSPTKSSTEGDLRLFDGGDDEPCLTVDELDGDERRRADEALAVALRCTPNRPGTTAASSSASSPHSSTHIQLPLLLPLAPPNAAPSCARSFLAALGPFPAPGSSCSSPPSGAKGSMAASRMTALSARLPGSASGSSSS